MNSRALSHGPEHGWSRWLLAALAVAGAMAIGAAFPPGAWYEQLIKPSWQPPVWVFAPAWAGIYATLAASLALLLSSPHGKDRRRALILFATQLALNAAWTPLFFGLQSPLLSFIDVIALWVAALSSALLAVTVRPMAAWLQIPNLLWVSFALVLNGVILALNG